MAFIGAALPYIAAGVGAASAANAGEQNARTLQLQGVVAQQQAFADEEAQRRENRQFRGRAAAALAENGLTPDGSSGLMVDQSASLAELDALNTRYHGMLRGSGLIAEGKDAKRRGYALAGQRLLQGASDIYGT